MGEERIGYTSIPGKRCEIGRVTCFLRDYFVCLFNTIETENDNVERIGAYLEL